MTLPQTLDLSDNGSAMKEIRRRMESAGFKHAAEHFPRRWPEYTTGTRYAKAFVWGLAS